MRPIMRFGIAALTIASIGSVAHARPITAGVGLGRIQSKANSEGSADSTLQLFARLGLVSRLGVQAEIQRIHSDSEMSDVKTFTALGTIDLAVGYRLAPMFLAGVGIDRASYWDDMQTGEHAEIGVALEYRADGGFAGGLDVRLGSRSMEPSKRYDPVTYPVVSPTMLQDGEYRSARIYVGMHF